MSLPSRSARACRASPSAETPGPEPDGAASGRPSGRASGPRRAVAAGANAITRPPVQRTEDAPKYNRDSEVRAFGVPAKRARASRSGTLDTGSGGRELRMRGKGRRGFDDGLASDSSSNSVKWSGGRIPVFSKLGGVNPPARGYAPAARVRVLHTLNACRARLRGRGRQLVDPHVLHVELVAPDPDHAIGVRVGERGTHGRRHFRHQPAVGIVHAPRRDLV